MARPIETPAGYRFAEIRVDARNRQLWRGGEIVPLNAKYFDVLVLLLERRGRLVTKGEIFDATGVRRRVGLGPGAGYATGAGCVRRMSGAASIRRGSMLKTAVCVQRVPRRVAKPRRFNSSATCETELSRAIRSSISSSARRSTGFSSRWAQSSETRNP
jgi:hypothetical protein